MSHTGRSRMPGLLLALILLILCGYLLLLFVVPHFLAFYSETGKPLPAALRAVASIMNAIKNSQTLIIPVFFVAFVGALAWLTYALVQLRKHKDHE